MVFCFLLCTSTRLGISEYHIAVADDIGDDHLIPEIINCGCMVTHPIYMLGKFCYSLKFCYLEIELDARNFPSSVKYSLDASSHP